MNLVSTKTPTPRVALARESPEFLDAALGIVSASHGLQVVPNQLIEALAEGLGFGAGAGDELVIDGERNVH